MKRKILAFVLFAAFIGLCCFVYYDLKQPWDMEIFLDRPVKKMEQIE